MATSVADQIRSRLNHFDRELVGQQLYRTPAHAGLGALELITRFGSDLNRFFTLREGSGTGGHDVWPRVKTDANRRALIESLKTI